MATQTRVLSGIQPSGALHLGNYFGAIRQHIELQTSHPGQAIYFIADYHALTTVKDPATLHENVFEAAVTYLALGLDPTQTLLFHQSDVPEVTELAFLLSTVTGMGLLQRAHSYKDKIDNGITPSVGLFFYPILMAADILAYDATIVPVGKDQIQHIEMAQDMGTHFNETYGSKKNPVLVRPEPLPSKTPLIPGLDGRKMSKSYKNTIPIFASGKKLRQLVGQIVTDSTPLGSPMPFETCNVAALLRLFCNSEELSMIEHHYLVGQRDGIPFGYGHAKMLLADKIEQHFASARARREYFLTPEGREEVEEVLARSAHLARLLAQETLNRCRRACGLR